MATITTTGFKEFINDLEDFGEDVDAMTEKMLDAGSNVAVEEWKDSIERHRYIDTGDMLASVGRAKKTPKNIAEIYPQGKDRKGIRNAEKAFILHYGTSETIGTGIYGSRFVDDIEGVAGPEINVAMGHVMDEYLKKHNLT